MPQQVGRVSVEGCPGPVGTCPPLQRGGQRVQLCASPSLGRLREMYRIFVILKEEGIGKSDNGRLEEMAGHMGGKMYVVYEGRARHLSPDDAEIIWTTEDWQEALDRATAHQGVVYVYDVTDQEEFIHETFAYDGTHS
jgi:hypothetical protein